MSDEISALLGVASYHDLITRICDDPWWNWSDPYWTRRDVIAEDVYGNKFPILSCMKDHVASRNLKRLGCCGSHRGECVWLAWDFDVEHGDNSFVDKPSALAEARRLRSELGIGEIRGSSGGRGYSLRVLMPEDGRFPATAISTVVKRINRRLGVRCDPSAAGRQVSFLWHREPPNGAFEQIEEHGKVEFDAPELVAWALAQPPEEQPRADRRDWGTSVAVDAATRRQAAEKWLASQPAGSGPRSPLGARNFRDGLGLAWDLGLPTGEALELLRAYTGQDVPSSGDLERWFQYARYPRGWLLRKIAREQGDGSSEQRRRAYRTAIGKCCRAGMAPREAIHEGAMDEGFAPHPLWVSVSEASLRNYLKGLEVKWNGTGIDTIMSSWLINPRTGPFKERAGLGRTAKDALVASLVEHHRLRKCLPTPGVASDPIMLPNGLLGANEHTARKARIRLELAGMLQRHSEPSRDAAGRFRIRLPLDEEREALNWRCQSIARHLRGTGARSYGRRALRELEEKLNQLPTPGEGGGNGIH